MPREREDAVEYLRSRGVQGSDDAVGALWRFRSLHRQAEDWLLDLVAELVLALLEGDAGRLADAESVIFYEEALVYRLLESPQPDLAWNVLNLGSELRYVRLGQRRGDFERGHRLFTAVLDHFGLLDDVPRLLQDGYADMGHDYSLYAMDCGYLEQAEDILRHLAGQHRVVGHFFYRGYTMAAEQDLIEALMLQGKLQEAEQLATELLALYAGAQRGAAFSEPADYTTVHLLGQRGYPIIGANPYARRAIARGLQGKTSAALADFKLAEAFQDGALRRNRHRLPVAAQGRFVAMRSVEDELRPLDGPAALYYAELLVRLGKLDSATPIARYHYDWGMAAGYPALTSHAELILSDIARLRGSHRRAFQWLDYSRDWALAVHHAEYHCRAQLAAGRVYLAQRHYERAQDFANEARRTASMCGLWVHEIDAQITLGRLAMLQDDARAAQQSAETALNMANNPGCGYAWGAASAIHLLGEIAHRRWRQTHSLADAQNARRYLERAAAQRDQIRDPRVRNTRQLLDELNDTA